MPHQAIERALLRQQEILAKFGELALRSESLDQILTEACRLVGEALETDLAKVMELQPDGETLLVRAGVGWKPDVVGKVTVKAVRGSSEGFALSTGEPVFSDDIATETRFEYADFIKDNGVRAIINVIILGAEDKPPFGILQVDSRVPRHFGEADTKFLRGYANLIAAAVDRLRVSDEVRAAQAQLLAREAELRALNETLEERVAQRTAALTAEQLSRQEAEEQLRQSQKMEAIGQLTGGIAHDFNNLLTGITGSLDIIRRRLASGRTDDIDRFMDGAVASALRAAALTQRLLAFSRRQSLHTQPCDVNVLVTGMEDMLRSSLGEQVHLEIGLDAGLWPALADANQFENAILNLAINARDAMPDGGQLNVTTRNAIVEATDPTLRENELPGSYVVVKVSDSGSGMAPDVVEKVFEPFFTTKAIGQGTGLGLSMIYGFVRQSGGYVRIESEAGKGTTVAIFLPRASVDAAPSEPDHSRLSPQGGGKTVLVVEDDATVRLLVIEVLEELGYLHYQAADAKEALAMINSASKIDLLVSDVGLPDMNGRQLAGLAQEARPGLKVLLVTGYAEKAKDRAEFLGADMDILLKPFTLDTLGLKIKAMIAA
jgi:signal transduction histidine kinase